MQTRRKIYLGLVAVLFLLVGGIHPALAIGVGDQAPDFELDSTKGGKLKLSQLRGKNVLINFYQNDFDPN